VIDGTSGAAPLPARLPPPEDLARRRLAVAQAIGEGDAPITASGVPLAEGLAAAGPQSPAVPPGTLLLEREAH